MNPLMSTLILQNNGSLRQYGDWYIGRWGVGCYIWYSEEGPGRAAALPNPLLALPNVTAHPSTASVPTSYYSMWHYNYLCTIVVIEASNCQLTGSIVVRCCFRTRTEAFIFVVKIIKFRVSSVSEWQFLSFDDFYLSCVSDLFTEKHDNLRYACLQWYQCCKSYPLNGAISSFKLYTLSQKSRKSSTPNSWR